MIPLKTVAMEDALDRATIRLGIYTLIANIYHSLFKKLSAIKFLIYVVQKVVLLKTSY